MSTLKLEIGEVAPTVPRRTTKFRRGYESVKPWVEFGLTVVLIIFAAPIILIGGILVRLSSPGPLFYTQKRLGRGGSSSRSTSFVRCMWIANETALRDGAPHPILGLPESAGGCVGLMSMSFPS